MSAPSPPPALGQGITLLALPHNIRHFIYAELLGLEPAITVHSGIAATHPLAQSCSLLRNEFLPRWQKHTTTTATEFHFEVTDFHFSDAEAFLQQLSLLNRSDEPRMIFIQLRLSNATEASWLYRNIEAFDDWVAWAESRRLRLGNPGGHCGLWYSFDFEVSRQYAESMAAALLHESPLYARFRPGYMKQHYKRIVEALRKAYRASDELVEQKYAMRREMTAMERDLWNRI